MPPGIEHALGIEALLDALGQRRERRPPAARTRRPRRAPRPARGSASRGRRLRRPRGRTSAAPASSRGASASPDQAAGPVVEHLAAAPARAIVAPSSAPRARRRRDTPERPLRPPRRRPARERRDVADRAPERARGRLHRSSPSAPNGVISLCEHAPAVRDRRRDALEPQRRDARGRRRRSRRGCDAATSGRQMRRARHVAGRAHGRRHRRDGPRRRRGRGPARVASVSGRGSTLIVTSVIAASVPQEPAISLQRS